MVTSEQTMNGMKKKIRAKNTHRIKRERAPSLLSYEEPPRANQKPVQKNSKIDCGWGRVIFAHTYETNEKIAQDLCDENRATRNIAFYLKDPHVVLSYAPQQLFLDPSHTYRIWFEKYRASKQRPLGFHVRRAQSLTDMKAINRILNKRQMVPIHKEKLDKLWRSKKITYLVAQEEKSTKIVGCVMGLDHKRCFDDPELGSSLWSLAVDPYCSMPGIGEALVRALIEHYQARGRLYLDLSVMHSNHQAIALYEKLNFRRVPVFCVKHKNAINEPLFTRTETDSGFNPYARIIIDEAKRRGISVNPIAPAEGFFELEFGGRRIRCRESLSSLTSAVAMSICSNKQVTSKLLAQAGLRVPAQIKASDTKKKNEVVLKKFKRVVVKPVNGEQGQGISVDITTAKGLHLAIERARQFDKEVLIEEYVQGQDLRVVVINYQVVAASLRVPPKILGTGKHSVKQLISKLSRKRAAATQGESTIPIDEETLRCIKMQGYSFERILKEGEELVVRKTANLHTGGILVDVTDELNPELKKVSEQAAQQLEIPVVGFDLIVKDHQKSDYVIIEANERVGLANHEPQPTAEKFVDLLFPQTIRLKLTVGSQP